MSGAVGPPSASSGNRYNVHRRPGPQSSSVTAKPIPRDEFASSKHGSIYRLSVHMQNQRRERAIGRVLQHGNEEEPNHVARTGPFGRRRRTQPWYWLDTLSHDLGFAFRLIARNPWLSATVLGTLTIGIALNVSAFHPGQRLSAGVRGYAATQTRSSGCFPDTPETTSCSIPMEEYRNPITRGCAAPLRPCRRWRHAHG